jgi:hypothetical protein
MEREALASIDLEARVAALSELVEQQAARLAALEDDLERREANEPDRPRSRRDILKLAGAAAAGVAGGALLNVMPAAAADGQPLYLANLAGAVPVTNDATKTTKVTPTSAAVDVSADATSSLFAADMQTAVNGTTHLGGGSAIGGIGSPGFAGVLGQGFTDASGTYASLGMEAVDPKGNGYGLIASSAGGLDVALYGTGRIHQMSIGTAGYPPFAPAQAPPAPGAFAFELVRDNNGVLWSSTAAGAWRRLNTPRFDKPDGSALFTPVRVVETRGAPYGPKGNHAGPLAPGRYTFQKVTGSNNIPDDAIALVGNLTAAGYTGQGFAAIMPTGSTFSPSSSPSSLNYGPPTYAWANAFQVALGAAGTFDIYVSATTHIIVDVVGYYQ